jgi:hypothetical protein
MEKKTRVRCCKSSGFPPTGVIVRMTSATRSSERINHLPQPLQRKNDTDVAELEDKKERVSRISEDFFYGTDRGAVR